MSLAGCLWRQRPLRQFFSSVSFLARPVTVSHPPHTRQLSVPASSSKTQERDGDAESSGIANTERHSDAAADHAAPLSGTLPAWRPPNRTITTLDPARLHSGCFVDISGVGQANIYAPFPGQAYPKSYPLMYHELDCKRSVPNAFRARAAFPPGTHGFLYFHAPSRDPAHAHIRFRVTDSSDPASFARGHDLVYGKGYVWYIPVARIAARADTDALLRVLLHDGLLDARQLAALRASGAPPHVRIKRAIGRLREPFVIEFAMYRHRITAAGETYPVTLVLPHFGYCDAEHRIMRLYEAGSALCRFERSTLPEHAGKRAIVIRLLKMLVPPKPVPERPPKCNLPLPAEGELFTAGGCVWYTDVSKESKKGRILRMLYDADADEDPQSP